MNNLVPAQPSPSILFLFAFAVRSFVRSFAAFALSGSVLYIRLLNLFG